MTHPLTGEKPTRIMLLLLLSHRGYLSCADTPDDSTKSQARKKQGNQLAMPPLLFTLSVYSNRFI
jgi:hypothetical protein